VENEWFIDFKRSLSFQDFERWSELKGELDRISLEYDQNDIMSWGLENKGLFTTKSLYRFILNGGSSSRMARHIWKCRVPLKINFFSWEDL
jgi:hypothetical protein